MLTIALNLTLDNQLLLSVYISTVLRIMYTDRSLC